jgi:SAM-dependent methyltransferase
MKTRPTRQTVRELPFEERRCPLCSEDRPRRLFSDLNRREGLSISGTVVECQSCRMRYLNPAPSAAGLAELYRVGYVDPVCESEVGGSVLLKAQEARLENGSGRRAVLHPLNEIFRGHPHDWPEEDGEGRSILDFGCHSGEKLVRWQRSGWSVAGIDLNEGAIAQARRRLPEGKFWGGDLLNLDISERFDFIRADNVVEHLLEPLPYLRALHRLLKRNGRMRVFVPNERGLSARVVGRYSYVYWIPFHVNVFSVPTLRAALEKAGFQQVECYAFAPVGSWIQTLRQLVLKPGFNRRPRSALDRVLRALSPASYPGEVIAHWLGYGDELVGTGTNAS